MQEANADKASVMWKGMECDYGDGNLKNLRIIDLSSNKLTGEIPDYFESPWTASAELIKKSFDRKDSLRYWAD
ncbi:hypothetical protein SLEP1_g52951 [Rubroshorea leprosula]|uniref:Uncharacterized protein n=1 Tax=Rubroshorea leprosula TaxID=152421 RepID=A0AAV5M7W0_9ROSI|nr:hypothetical protein SLEP1_g52951 [Rubroshorea leprosula]